MCVHTHTHIHSEETILNGKTVTAGFPLGEYMLVNDCIFNQVLIAIGSYELS
jgi:hypothetical protein